MEQVVEDFVNQYKIELDYFTNLSEIARNICDTELQAVGVKAITSWRAKNPDSLRSKLLKRDKEKQYKHINEIRKDITDLSGVRIALYFPSEIEAVDKILNEIFMVKNKKTFPEQSQKPTHSKRFSGYGATHYRVTLKPTKDLLRYCDHIVEIQVASVLMHSWSEIEHDLIYKPHNGNISEEELKILDEINGLVLVGEIALERLQKTMMERINKKGKFEDSYELKSYLSNYINNIDSKNIGNIKYLNEIMNSINFNSKTKINKLVSELNYYPEATIADEMIDKILFESIKNDRDVEKIINSLIKNNKNMSGFECFLKLWILMESVNQYILQFYEVKEKTYGYRFDIYLKAEILNYEEVESLKEFRNIRNKLVHGIGMYEDDYLLQNFDSLQNIVLKIIDSIKEPEVKGTYIAEYKRIIKKT